MIRRKRYQKYGESLHRYPNLLNRDFHADRPNQKWVTDISYIKTGQGFLYLSVIRDLFDNSIVAYRTGTENFFSILKTECIHRLKLHTFEKANAAIDVYIQFYNSQRIQLKAELTPVEFRCQFIS